MEEKTKRFFKVLDTLDVSGYKLSKQSNLVTQQKLTNARKGRNTISTDIVMELSRLYKQVNPDYILIGEGPMFLTGDITQSGDANNANNSGTINNDIRRYYQGCNKENSQEISELGERVTALEGAPTISYSQGKPYYNVDFLGGFDIIINDQTVNPEYLIDFKKYEDADCWCNISGQSMEPLISNGDIIAIKQLHDWREFLLYGEVYGIVTKDMRTVKLVTKSPKGDDYLHLVPVNKSEEYQPQDIPVKLITHVFQVLGCMKKL